MDDIYTNYIIRGVAAKGTKVFYTGQAGPGWVSTDRSLAFTYGRDRARSRAKQFNRNFSIHGVWFVAVSEYEVAYTD